MSSRITDGFGEATARRWATAIVAGLIFSLLVVPSSVFGGSKKKEPKSAKSSSASGKASSNKTVPGRTVPVAQTPRSYPEVLAGIMSKLPHANAVGSAVVIDLKSNQVVFEHKADQAQVPASNMKVFAMAAALVELGPDFSFETVLGFDGKNLLLIGDGDPGFGDEKIMSRRGGRVESVLDQWASELKARGVTQIAGDVIFDDTIFEDRKVHPSWEADDLGKWYAAPVTGLTINDGCLDITATLAGKEVRHSVVPRNSVASINNTIQFGQGSSPLLHHSAGTNSYKLSGKTNKPYTFGPVPFVDPAILCADALKSALGRNGIAVAGQVRRARVRQADGSLPPQVQVVARHATPMAEVLNRAGKDSQNLFAECLLKRAGYAWQKNRGVANPTGSWESGAAAVVDMLQHAGIPTAGLTVADGSGLSRDNRCTARQLAAVNAWMQTAGKTSELLSSSASMDKPPKVKGGDSTSPSPTTDSPILESCKYPPTSALTALAAANEARLARAGELYRESLAVAGVDGSLKRRMKSEGGKVRGKTGTMKGIRTLSGYVDDENGPRFAYAIMFNGYSGSSAPYKDIQDRMCGVLVDQLD